MFTIIYFIIYIIYILYYIYYIMYIILYILNSIYTIIYFAMIIFLYFPYDDKINLSSYLWKTLINWVNCATLRLIWAVLLNVCKPHCSTYNEKKRLVSLLWIIFPPQLTIHFSYLIFQRFIIFTFQNYSLQNCLWKIGLCI